MNIQGSSDCAGRICGWGAFEGDMGCDSGPGSCWSAKMLRADESGFHDHILQEATREIDRILAAIPEDKGGRKLSFVHTKHGTMLAWVNHGGSHPDGAVTVESDHEKVVKALKIKS